MQNPTLNKVVEWNPGNAAQFALGYSGKLELLEISGDNVVTKAVKEIYTHPHAVQPTVCTCINWHSDTFLREKSILAYGTSIGQIFAISWSSKDELMVHNPVAASRRVCTGIAWNKSYTRYLAAGFEKSRSLNEFCAVVWDLEHSEKSPTTGETTTSILFKPPSEEPISSICWLQDHHSLAVGTSISHVRIYDIRMESNVSEVLSIAAHLATRPRKIKGIRQDPFSETTIATFSDSALEPVKVWDLRKGNNPKPKLTIYPHTTPITDTMNTNVNTSNLMNISTLSSSSSSMMMMNTLSSQSAVVDIAWSMNRANILAVATTHQKSISFYSTFKNPPDAVTRTPIYTTSIPDYAKSLSWQMNSHLHEHSDMRNNTTSTATNIATTIAGGTNTSMNTNSVQVTSDEPTTTSTNATTSGSNNNNQNNMSVDNYKLLIATTTGFYHMNVIENVGLSMGRHVIGNSSGNHIQLSVPTKHSVCELGNASTTATKSSPESLVNTSVNMEIQEMKQYIMNYMNTESNMIYRCRHGYNLDTGKNVQLFSEEIEKLKSYEKYFNDSVQVGKTENNIHGNTGTAASSILTLDQYRVIQQRVNDLYSVWSCIYRIESLSHTEDLSLRTCGLISLLLETYTPSPLDSSKNSNAISNSTTTTATKINSHPESRYHTQLGTVVYTSKYREKSRLLCGWCSDIIGIDSDSSTTMNKSMIAFMKKCQDKRDDNSTRANTFKTPTKITTSHISQSHDDNDNTNNDENNHIHYEKNDNDNENDEDVDLYEDELYSLITQCQEENEFERAAALALWHGNIYFAIQILQHVHDYYSTKNNESIINSSTEVNKNLTTTATSTATTTTAAVVSTSEAVGYRERLSITKSPIDISNTNTNNTNTNDNRDENNYQSDDLQPVYDETIILSSQYLHMLSLVAMCLAGYQPISPYIMQQQSGYRRPFHSTTNNNSTTTATTPSLSNTNTNTTTNNTIKNMNAIMWNSMCELVLTQLQSIVTERPASCYLINICKFLLINNTSSLTTTSTATTTNTTSTTSMSTDTLIQLYGKYYDIISDERLLYEDRIAFGCTYLDDTTLYTWFTTLRKEAENKGNLQGLLLTGLSAQGIQILQQYMDQSSDIQTVALLVGRLLENNTNIHISDSPLHTGPNHSNNSNSSSNNSYNSTYYQENMWLHEYRQLLNKWKMFYERACLDVELGKYYRLYIQQQQIESSIQHQNQSKGTNSTGKNSTRTNIDNKGGIGGGGKNDKKMNNSTSTDIMSSSIYTIPPHQELPSISLRCHYCGAALPMNPFKQNNTTVSFLRKQKSIINCCSHCKKQLPRCYICLMYMGMMNPNVELTRTMAIRRQLSDEAMKRRQRQLQQHTIMTDINDSEIPLTSTTRNMMMINNNPLITTNRSGTTTTTTTTTTADVNLPTPMTTASSTSSAYSATANTLNTPTTPLVGIDHDTQKNIEQNALEYGQWFFFCQQCRHGGHAICIESWFQISTSSSSSSTTTTSANGSSSVSNKIHGDRNDMVDTCMLIDEKGNSIPLYNEPVKKRDMCGVNGCYCRCQSLR